MEKRKCARAPLRESVLVVDERGERLSGHASDISLGGMFIAGVTAAFGAHVTVHVHLPGEREAVTLPGVVRWVRGDGFGVQFGLLGARETHAITEAVARAAPSHTTQRASSPTGEFLEVELDEVEVV